MTSEPPRVTVFIPTFNRLHKLQRAVESVRQQGDCVHLHVLDNASTDGTREWLQGLAREMPGVELTLREKNEGALASFAEGFGRVRTPYVVPLADDDELSPGFLAAALQIAAEQPDLGAVVFTTESRSDGKVLERSPADPRTGRRKPCDHLLEWAERGHYVSWSSILWRTDAFLRIQPADQLQQFGFVSDVWMQFLVFSECDVFIQNQPGSIFHVHPGQWSRKIDAESLFVFGRMVREMDRVLAEKKTLVGDGRRKFLADVCLRFNAMVADQCRQTKDLPDDVTLRRWMDAYLELVYPHAGFARFPLLPLFEEFRSTIAALETAGAALHDQDARLQEQHKHLQDLNARLLDLKIRLPELQEKADRFDAMEHSLRWRLTKPLVLFTKTTEKIKRLWGFGRAR